MDITTASYIKGRPITNKNQLPYSVKTNTIDKEWDANIQNMWWYHNSSKDVFKQKSLYDLRKKLLSFGGYEVCLPIMDSDADNILTRGQFWYGDRFLLRKGIPCHCHDNSAILWNKAKDKLFLCTGYALSQDGMWRQHSWCVEPRIRKSRIIETTVERVGYFGFILNNDEAEKFYNMSTF